MKGLLMWVAGVAVAAAASAEPIRVPIHAISAQGVGEPVGQVTFESSRFGGVIIRPELSGLSPGMHGFHIHANPDCGPGIDEGQQKAGIAAGGHFDPRRTDRHAGPYGRGHLGDLPVLHVAEDGTASTPTLAPRLSLADLRGHSVIVHEGGDNYADEPEPLGGGGPRIACGVIPGRS